MPPIRTIYVVNHSHTDIGFTDYQDLCFRQHAEFIDQAIDLIEATQDYPPEARFRWVCEVTGVTEKYLARASPAQIERFKQWNTRGFIDVAGMQYHHTPLQNVEQMIRSLYPVRRLRESYGLSISTAMQCDVGGVSWLYADLLAQIGVELITMAVNPRRGPAPQPTPSAFWWEGPAGNKILAWNGFPHRWGRSIANLGDWRSVDQSLPTIVARLEADPSYPYDFIYAQATHPIRVDNGPPDARIPDFVRDWNARGRTPRIALTTPAAFNRMLRIRHGADLPAMRGDWLDSGAVVVASSAYETGVGRATREQLVAAETIAAWLQSLGTSPWPVERMAGAYEESTLYNEHTWGSFSGVEAPGSLWTRGQWNRKAGYAYAASAESLDLLTRASRSLAETAAEPSVESGSDALLVINTLPWPRSVLVEEPERHGGAAPIGVVESFLPRNLSPAGRPIRRMMGEVPGFGYAFLSLGTPPAVADLEADNGTIENAHYRIRIDPTTGALAEWIDKDLGHDFAGRYLGWGIGQYVYERAGSVEERASFLQSDPPPRWTVSDATVGAPVVAGGRVSIAVQIAGPGVRAGRCEFALETARKTLEVNWLLDKEHETEIESVFIAFPFRLGPPSFRADVNGVPFTPNADQLNGTITDWYPIGRWVDVGDSLRGVTVAPLDAPLMQFGGIRTGQRAEYLEPEGPTLISRALTNQRTVNIKASQGGEIPLRYRLTTYAGGANDVAAARFGAECATPPIVLRDYRRTGPETGRFLDVPPGAPVLVTAKPAENGDGVIVRVQNLTATRQTVPLRFNGGLPRSAALTSPLENGVETLLTVSATVNVPVAPLAVQSVRIRF